MSRNTFQIALIIGLLIANILLVSFLWLGRNHHFRDIENRPRNAVIEKLGFDDAQIAQYDQLIATHRQQIHQNDSLMLLQKEQLYAYLNKTPNTAAVDSLTTEMGILQKNTEKIHFQHFMDIKNICTPEQLPKFELFTQEINRIFSSKPPKK
ncbi:MAG: hypothetical protein R2798_04255 [Chitinophagales bacterium]|nr:periplasmic heavy metal sensor [Bacteroidota bacterium]